MTSAAVRLRAPYCPNSGGAALADVRGYVCGGSVAPVALLPI